MLRQPAPLPVGGRQVLGPPAFPRESKSVWSGARPSAGPNRPARCPPGPGAGAGARAAADCRSFPPAEVGEEVVPFNPGFPELFEICISLIRFFLPSFWLTPFSSIKSGLYSVWTGVSPNLSLSATPSPAPQPFTLLSVELCKFCNRGEGFLKLHLQSSVSGQARGRGREGMRRRPRPYRPLQIKI